MSISALRASSWPPRRSPPPARDCMRIVRHAAWGKRDALAWRAACFAASRKPVHAAWRRVADRRVKSAPVKSNRAKPTNEHPPPRWIIKSALPWRSASGTRSPEAMARTASSTRAPAVGCLHTQRDVGERIALSTSPRTLHRLQREHRHHRVARRRAARRRLPGDDEVVPAAPSNARVSTQRPQLSRRRGRRRGRSARRSAAWRAAPRRAPPRRRRARRGAATSAAAPPRRRRRSSAA